MLSSMTMFYPEDKNFALTSIRFSSNIEQIRKAENTLFRNSSFTNIPTGLFSYVREDASLTKLEMLRINRVPQ